MIRVSYQLGQSVQINTTMNEARGILSQEIVVSHPDAVSTVHLSKLSAMTPEKLRELADLLDGPRAGCEKYAYEDHDPDDWPTDKEMQEIHRDTPGDIVCRKCRKIISPDEKECPHCKQPELKVYKGFDGPISKRTDHSIIPF